MNHVTFEHRFQGRVYQFELAKEINYQYQRMWKTSCFDPNADIMYKMECLVNMGKYDPVAMYFRNNYIAEYEESPDGVPDVYHRELCGRGYSWDIKVPVWS